MFLKAAKREKVSIKKKSWEKENKEGNPIRMQSIGPNACPLA